MVVVVAVAVAVVVAIDFEDFVVLEVESHRRTDLGYTFRHRTGSLLL